VQVTLVVDAWCATIVALADAQTKLVAVVLTAYSPAGSPVKLNVPVVPVVAVRFAAPVSVTVAPLIGEPPLATIPLSSPTLTSVRK
jgi:hypothetical protein